MLKPLNIVLTGGNSGIGYQTAKSLYEQGHNIVFGSRNKIRNEQCVTKIKQKEGGSIISFPLDLSVRRSIEQFAANVRKQYSNIDMLINNSGLILAERQMSQLNIQMTMTINHFGHFLLTSLLFDLIKKSKQGRIINVSSGIHTSAEDEIFGNLKLQRRQFSSSTEYANSKMANIQFTVGLAKRLKQKYPNIKAASLHPGLVATGFFNNWDVWYIKCFKSCCACFFKDSNQGARTTLHLAQIPFEQIRNGQYYTDQAYKQMDRRGRDDKNVEKLWKISEEMYKIKFEI